MGAAVHLTEQGEIKSHTWIRSVGMKQIAEAFPFPASLAVSKSWLKDPQKKQNSIRRNGHTLALQTHFEEVKRKQRSFAAKKLQLNT